MTMEKKKRDYRQALQIGNALNDIFPLPCVRSICKDGDGVWLFMVHTSQGVILPATTGDWLCERKDGTGWDVFTPLEWGAMEGQDDE